MIVLEGVFTDIGYNNRIYDDKMFKKALEKYMQKNKLKLREEKLKRILKDEYVK